MFEIENQNEPGYRLLICTYEAGYRASSGNMEKGDPVNLIVEKRKQHSLIILAATEKPAPNRWCLGGVTHEVLKNATNSVMVTR